MADIAYYGDQAGVLPDNTNAFIHFTDQFAQLEQQRKASEAAAAKLERERYGRVQKVVSDKIYNPAYLKNDDTNPILRENMDGLSAKVFAALKTGGEEAAMDEANKGALDLAGAAQRIDETNKNIIGSAANRQAKDPLWDGAAAMAVMHTKAFMKRDANGKLIHKDLNEINPTTDYLSQSEQEHGGDFYSHDAMATQFNLDLAKEKDYEEKVQPEIDAKGNVTKLGYDAKLSNLVHVTEDGKGGHAVQLNAELYHMPGTDVPYTDPITKQAVKVLPKNLYDEFNHGAIKEGIRQKVEADLSKAAQFSGSPVPGEGQESSYGPQSEYANMLRQKYMYEEVYNNVKDRYKVSTNNGRKEGDALKDKLADNARQNQSQRIAQAHLDIAQEKLAIDKKKDAKKEITVDDITPLTVTYGKAAGVKVHEAVKDANGKWVGIEKTFVEIKDIDPGQLDIITGTTGTGAEKKSLVKPVTKVFDGVSRTGFYSTPEGDWIGAGDQVIKKEAVMDRQLKGYTKDDLPLSSQGKVGVLERAGKVIKAALTPKAKTVKAPSKLKGIEKGGLN